MSTRTKIILLVLMMALVIGGLLNYLGRRYLAEPDPPPVVSPTVVILPTPTFIPLPTLEPTLTPYAPFLMETVTTPLPTATPTQTPEPPTPTPTRAPTRTSVIQNG